MAMISKTRGKGYEYRIRDLFRNEDQNPEKPLGWKAERNELSKAKKAFGRIVAKHDVYTWKQVGPDECYFLQMEAKKTASEIHTIQWEWIEKIDFTNDELLVFALNRTTNYAFLTSEAYLKWNSDVPPVFPPAKAKIIECRGEDYARIHAEEILDCSWKIPVVFKWNKRSRDFVIVPLLEFVSERLKFPPNVKGIPINEPPAELSDNSDTVEVKTNTITCPKCGHNFPIQGT